MLPSINTRSVNFACPANLTNSKTSVMSAVTELSIVLQHDIDEQYQYQPGEIIRGTIYVTVARPTAIRAITVKVSVINARDCKE